MLSYPRPQRSLSINKQSIMVKYTNNHEWPERLWPQSKNIALVCPQASNGMMHFPFLATTGALYVMTYIYGDKIWSCMVQFILGGIHWSLFIDTIRSLSICSSWFFFLACYTYVYIVPFLSIHLACISLAAHIQYIDIMYIHWYWHWHLWVDESKTWDGVKNLWGGIKSMG